MLIEVNSTTYYGDNLDVNLEGSHYPHYRYNEKYNCFSDFCCDSERFQFEYEDNAKAMSNALKRVAEMMKVEGFDPKIESKDVADLAKLLDDNLLGEELYNNLKANLALIQSIEALKSNDHTEFFTNFGYYCSGNNLCYFGQKNAMNLIKKPEQFKETIIQICIEHKNKKLLEQLGFYSKEIEAEILEHDKKLLELKIAKAKRDIKKTNQNLEKYKKELKNLESK